MPETEVGCVCEGNWRLIIHETRPLLGKQFIKDHVLYTLFGVIYCEDDFYYGMCDENSQVILASCVVSLETAGYILLEDHERQQEAEKSL